MAKRDNQQRRRIPIVEWVFAGFGAALVLAAIAILLHSAATSPPSAPRLSVRVTSIEPAGEQFVVLLEAFNEGGSTAADARIEAELRQNGSIIERSETTLDFIPPKSRRRAGVFFRQDPRRSHLTLRAAGYRDP
jgi:uncharacterized protein (TIGR02588 family)